MINNTIKNTNKNVDKNYLDRSKYLITGEMFEALLKESLYNDKSIGKRNGIYVIAVRRLNNNKNNLIYNYIFYPDIFYDPYIAFLSVKNIDSIRFRDWGDNLVILDINMLQNLKGYKYIKDHFKKDEFDSLDINTLEDKNTLLKQLISDTFFYGKGKLNIIRIISKLNFITKDVAGILNYAILEDYNNLIKSILPYEYYFRIEDVLNTPIDETINIINSTIFVVRDLRVFTTKISNKGYTISEGPQSWRGQINSMSSLLSSMDLDFRNSLYNHHNYFVEKGLIDKNLTLDKSKFSFKNIHMNLGNIRW